MDIVVGMQFDTGKNLVKHLRDYALAEKKSAKVSSRAGNNRVLVCTGDRCPFKVVAYERAGRAPDELPWYISSATLEHRECMSMPKPSALQLAQLPSVRSAVEGDRRVSAAFLQGQVQSLHCVSTQSQKRTVYRAKRIVEKSLEQNELDSYRFLPGFLGRLQELNPGTITKCDQSSDGHFTRCLFVCGAAVHAQEGMQRILGVDGAHCKHKLYGDVQLVLVGRDGNMRNVRFASALVQSENTEDYVWFFAE